MPRGEPLVTVGFKLHPDLIAEVDAWAAKRGQTRSEALKVLLRYAWKRRAVIALTEHVPATPRGPSGLAATRAAAKKKNGSQPNA